MLSIEATPRITWQPIRHLWPIIIVQLSYAVSNPVLVCKWPWSRHWDGSSCLGCIGFACLGITWPTWPTWAFASLPSVWNSTWDRWVDFFLKWCVLLIHFVGFITIRPPVLKCPNRLCKMHGHHLTRPLNYHSTLFTVESGPIPAFPVSLHCNGERSWFWSERVIYDVSGCNTRYYSNYFVHSKSELHTYYSDVMPAVLHISQKFFIESKLCELFTNQMMMGWWVSFIFDSTY